MVSSSPTAMPNLPFTLNNTDLYSTAFQAGS